MLKKIYDSFMNEEKNAFLSLPKAVRFELMSILAYMWCAIFSLGIGSFLFFGTSVIMHLLILLGIFFTADLFKKAANREIDSDIHHNE